MTEHRTSVIEPAELLRLLLVTHLTGWSFWTVVCLPHQWNLSIMIFFFLFRPSEFWGYSSHYAYAESKLALVMSAYKLHHEFSLDKCPVTVNAIHPGVVNTNLYKYVHWSLKCLLDFLAKSLYKVKDTASNGTFYTLPCYRAINWCTSI